MLPIPFAEYYITVFAQRVRISYKVLGTKYWVLRLFQRKIQIPSFNMQILHNNGTTLGGVKKQENPRTRHGAWTVALIK